jgi:hypothetical protein
VFKRTRNGKNGKNSETKQNAMKKNQGPRDETKRKKNTFFEPCIELNTKSQGWLVPALFHSSPFDEEVEAYLASIDHKSERKLERNMFISQLTL